MSRFLKLLTSVLICLSIGWLGGIITQHSVTTWYPNLLKPVWTPPNWTFPVVWTILYALMGYALWLIWISPSGRNKTPAYLLFGCQLFFNFIWSYLFFYLQNPLLGLIDIFILWISILFTMIVFYFHSKTATYLLIPYLAWVTYAASLNLWIWLHN